METWGLFNISMATLFRRSQKIDPQRTRDNPPIKIDMEALKKDVEDYPDAYHYERANRLKVPQRTIGYALKRLGVTYKKTSITPKRIAKDGLLFAKRLKPLKIQESLLFISMKVNLDIACQGLMAI
jgi:hypothetical protein